MLDKSKYLQYGFPRENEVKCIVIHNTGNKLPNAKSYFKYFSKEDKTNAGCHYLVDDKEIIEVMPEDYSVYHTGKGVDYACKYGIAIEIVSNIDDDIYKKGQDRAISLIKQLMEKYSLTINDIYFHNDFANIYCPKDILMIYGNKQNFLRKEFN